MTSAPGKKPTHKFVDFDLPFVLQLRDSMTDPELEDWLDAYKRGKPLPAARYAPSSTPAAGSGKPAPVFVPSIALAPFLEIVLPECPVGLLTLRRVNPHRPKAILGEAPGDRAGRVSFSSVRAMMSLDTMPPRFQDNAAWLCELAVAAVNHLIAHYRVIASRPWVRPVTVGAIQEFQVTTVFEDESTTSEDYHAPGPMQGFENALPAETEQQLRTAIGRPDPPPVSDALLNDVLDHLDCQEWQLAIIASADVFEAWLAAFLRDRLAKRGLSHAVIEKGFADPDGPKSVAVLATWGVREAASFDFSATPEFRAWASDVQDLRTMLVHDARRHVTGQDADKAYRAVAAAINLLAMH